MKLRAATVYAYDERELAFIARNSGFELSIAGVSFEYGVPDFRGLPYMRSYLFLNRLTRDDEDNGYGSFCRLPENQRISHLNDLRTYGAWIRIRELVDNCKSAIPDAMQSDLYALSYCMTSDRTQGRQVISEGDYSESVRYAIALSAGDYSNGRPRKGYENCPDLSIFSPLSRYLAGDYSGALRFCEATLGSGGADPRILIIRAASACRQGRREVAVESIEEFFLHRQEMLQ